MVAKDKSEQARSAASPQKLILFCQFEETAIDASSLQSGRLPEAGRDQVVAGASAAHSDRVKAGERDLEVVGVLKPDFAAAPR